MTDDKERVDWSALMDAHGIEPDADTASPAVEPASRVAAEGERGGRGRLVHVVVAVTALFSIAASAAVLIVILRGDDGDGGTARAAADEPMVPVGPRPAAFEQTSDGVIVVPPAPEPPPPAPEPPPTAPEPPTTAPAKKKSQPAKPPAAPVAKEEPAPAPAPEPPPDPNLPDEPDGAAVTAAMAGLEKDIAACAQPAKVSGAVDIKMRIDPDGKVAWAAAKVQNSPFQACLDRLFKKARMPRSAKGATVRQTVQLP